MGVHHHVGAPEAHPGPSAKASGQAGEPGASPGCSLPVALIISFGSRETEAEELGHCYTKLWARLATRPVFNPLIFPVRAP